MRERKKEASGTERDECKSTSLSLYFPPFLTFDSVLLMQKHLSHFTTSNNLFYLKKCTLKCWKVRRKEEKFGVSHACIMFPVIFPLSLSICLLDDSGNPFFHSIPQEGFSRTTPGFDRRANLSSEMSQF